MPWHGSTGDNKMMEPTWNARASRRCRRAVRTRAVPPEGKRIPTIGGVGSVHRVRGTKNVKTPQMIRFDEGPDGAGHRTHE